MERKIVISAESTIDLPKSMLEEFNIHTVPFTVMLGDKARLDGEFDTKEIFDFVFETKKLPKTSAVNEYQYQKHFTKLLKEYDYVIHFTLSSEMSSAYSNACKVSDKLNGRVFVVDSRSLSTGIALLAIYAAKLSMECDDPEIIVEKVKKRIPYNQASFVLSKLDYLYKGGRCNSLQLLASSLLRIRPQIVVADGKMRDRKKFLGNYDSCVEKYVNVTLELFPNPDLEEVFITYTTAKDSTILKVKEKLIKRGFKNVRITHAGATITSHCGEHCLGILYINDGGNN
jgi:DegV family protein with EDD domain